jgi:two-component system, NtrC family, response regulator PilR
MRILIVDDEQAILVSLKMYLESTEMRVDTAETLLIAKKFVEENRYDYIISDIRLNGVLGEEGLDILQLVKQKKQGTKVIIITGYSNQELMQRAYRYGADLYFEKPVSANDLLDAMKKIGS